MKLLEEKVASLESDDSDSSEAPTYPWHSWTFKQLKNKDEETLQTSKTKIIKKLKGHTLLDPLKVIVDELLEKASSKDNKLIRNEIIKSSRIFDEILIDSTFLYLIELELSLRSEDEEFDYEILATEQRIEELEKIVEDMKKSKTTAKN